MRKSFKNTFSLMLALLLASCASSEKVVQERALEKDLARLELEKSHRIPSLFSEHWFGTFLRIRDNSGSVIYVSNSDSADTERVQSFDLQPGKYSVLVLCRTHAPFKGSGSASLASTQITLTAGENIKLRCEQFEKEHDSDDQKKRRASDYGVRLSEI